MSDIDTTAQVYLAGELLGIKLQDHIIVSDKKQLSIRQNSPEFWDHLEKTAEQNRKRAITW